MDRVVGQASRYTAEQRLMMGDGNYCCQAKRTKFEQSFRPARCELPEVWPQRDVHVIWAAFSLDGAFCTMIPLTFVLLLL